MGKVIWTDPALEDLHDIIEHIAEDSPVYAERFGFHVVESPRRLEQFPYWDAQSLNLKMKISGS